jgi:hypothetical protein
LLLCLCTIRGSGDSLEHLTRTAVEQEIASFYFFIFVFPFLKDSKSGKPTNGPRATREVFISGTEPGQGSGKASKQSAPSKIEQSDDDVLREDR